MLYIGDFYILYFLAFTGAVLALLKKQYPLSAVLFVYAFAGIFYYLKFGTVRKAYAAYGKGKIRRAERLLALTKYPEKLDDLYKSKYYLLKGLIAYHRNDFASAYKHLIRALNLGHLTLEERQLADRIVNDLRQSVM